MHEKDCCLVWCDTVHLGRNALRCMCKSLQNICGARIWYCYSGVHTGEWLRTFRWRLVLPSSGYIVPVDFRFMTLKVKVPRSFETSGISPNYTASHPASLESLSLVISVSLLVWQFQSQFTVRYHFLPFRWYATPYTKYRSYVGESNENLKYLLIY
jgi:hypothetical protein